MSDPETESWLGAASQQYNTNKNAFEYLIIGKQA